MSPTSCFSCPCVISTPWVCVKPVIASTQQNMAKGWASVLWLPYILQGSIFLVNSLYRLTLLTSWSGRVGKTHVVRNVDDLEELWVTSGIRGANNHQSIRNKGPEFYHHKEMKTANNLSDRWEHSGADTLIAALWDAKQRTGEVINACYFKLLKVVVQQRLTL